MNFYIDFEATQFTEEIISIGCVAENGNVFNCLVCPSDLKKVTKFITNLTGITREMLENQGYSPEMAFYHLFNFVQENNGNSGAPVFYCYGSSDKNFIKNTIKHMSNLNMIIFASSIQSLMVDYATVVKNYFSTHNLALKKLVALVRHVDEVEQCHDALDDALMLKECYEGLHTLDKNSLSTMSVNSSKKNTSFEQAYQQLIDENGMLTPIKLQGRNISQQEKQYMKTLRCETWGGLSVDEVTGDATERDYVVKLTRIKKGTVKYFSSLSVAAMFFNAYHLKNRSPKETKALNNTMKEYARNPNNFCGYRCEIKVKEGLINDNG